MTILDSILKTRDITLPTKVYLVKAMFFPAVMYGCESWSIKKAEHQIIDAFELRCWRRLLRVPWTPSRSKQSILKETSPEYSLDGVMLQLKLQHFGDSPGANAGVGCHALLQGIFLTQGSNPGLLHCRKILNRLSHQGSPRILEWVAYPSPGVLPTQESNRSLLHCRRILYQLSYQGSLFCFL